jgi:choline dehydrogenase-like flavoprotein
MIIDARDIPNNQEITSDVCIVGAGAAGITLALEFKDQPFQVVLVESGGLKMEHRTQHLYNGENIGEQYPHLEFSRQRYFGGATNKWLGLSRPLDSIDFEERSWVPHSGWPFTKETLDPYYVRARSICQLDPEKSFDVESWEKKHHRRLPLEYIGLETKIFLFSPPTNFKTAYLNEIKNANNIQALLHANAIDIEVNGTANQISKMQIATLSGKSFAVQAKIFILAMGGIENPRLLLASNKVHREGIGNQHDLVGRFFMDHPHYVAGIIPFPVEELQIDLYKAINLNNIQKNPENWGAISLSEDSLRQRKMINASAFFLLRPSYKLDHQYYSRGTTSLLNLGDILNHTTSPFINVFHHLKNVVQQPIPPIKVILRMFKHMFNPYHWVGIKIETETFPNPDSRVTLSSKRDRLGVPKPILNWQLTQHDLENIGVFENLVFTGLEKIGYKVLVLRHDKTSSGWPVSFRAAKHHIGTTRMHQNPKRGVVDKNCKVHGIENSYIAGSSIFPTSGQANPTLTIVALAIRLADHIKSYFTHN